MSYKGDLKRISQSSLPWEMLKGKNILVVGATGMIGSAFVEMLLLHSPIDYHVYASGRSQEKFKKLFASYLDKPNLHFVEYDVCESLHGDTEFHIIVYCAGIASPSLYLSSPVEVVTSNIMGVNNVWAYGVKHGLERFLYLSSGEVYGEGNGRAFKEDEFGYVNCTQLRAAYPSAKRAAESLCIAYGHQYGIETVIARPCHVYGPVFSDYDNRIYAEFIRKVIGHETIVLKSKGNQMRSWCYVADCVSALLYILLKGKNRQAYNIADSSSVMSIRVLADMFASIGNTEVVYDIPSEEEQRVFNPMEFSALDASLLSSLGWTCEGSMIEKVKRTIDARLLYR